MLKYLTQNADALPLLSRDRIYDWLEGRGVAPAAIDRVRCPVGLDLGGKAPQEVAVSVVAELLKTYYAK